MIIARTLRANRKWFVLGLFGLIPLFGGCDSADQNTKPAAPAQTQAQQDAERAGREKSGPQKPGGAPATKPAPTTPVDKPADKAVEKTAEKPAPPK